MPAAPRALERDTMQPPPSTGRQLVKFSFFHLLPSWRQLPAAKRATAREEVVEIVERHAVEMPLRAYSTVGTRGDVDFGLRMWSPDVEAFTALHAAINAAAIGAHLTQPHSFLALLRKSVYVHIERDKQDPHKGMTFDPNGRKYLFVYPFVKTRPWYTLSLDDRQRMMDEHIAIGRSYPGISINTSYSFGLDDQEFVVAFEGDKISEFLDLVMELRASEASQYTLRDTPSFTCAAMPIDDALRVAGG
jgi:chlorite dismutase